MKKPIIIAELCQNHNGSPDILMRMLDEAVESGADYVKIQSIRSRNLTKRTRFEEGVVDEDGVTKCICRPYNQEKERLKNTSSDKCCFSSKITREKYNVVVVVSRMNLYIILMTKGQIE